MLISPVAAILALFVGVPMGAFRAPLWTLLAVALILSAYSLWRARVVLKLSHGKAWGEGVAWTPAAYVSAAAILLTQSFVALAFEGVAYWIGRVV